MHPDASLLCICRRRQVEYYFSRENLVQDAFLVSKMDKEHYVDLSVIADFKLMKALTSEESLILQAVKSSPKITVDETAKRLRPTVSNARTTLILRNIPSSTPEGDLKKFLVASKVPTMVSIRSDVGDNWFVSFETEEMTKAALDLVKPLKWDNKAIGCAIKSESLLKGITPGSPPKVTGNAGFYMPMHYGGAYGYAYPQGEGGQGGFRQGGRGGARRGPGGVVNGAGVGGNGSVDVAEGSGKRPGKKGKARGVREGGVGGREGGSAVGGADKDASKEASQQPPINMADFPELETKGGATKVSPREGEWGDKKLDLRASAASIVANGLPKSAALETLDDKKGSAAAPSGVNALSNGSADKEASGPMASDNSSATSSDGALSPVNDVPAQQPKSKKMSYAQMAQIKGAQPVEAK